MGIGQGTGVLTEKQEAFAVAYVETANAAEAYRRSHDVDPNARDEWIYIEARQVRDNPKVAPRIKELQALAQEAGQYTINQAAEELEEARALAMRESLPSAAVSATNSKVKLYGLDRPQKIQNVGADGEPLEAVSTETAARAIAHILGQAMRSDGGA